MTNNCSSTSVTICLPIYRLAWPVHLSSICFCLTYLLLFFFNEIQDCICHPWRWRSCTTNMRDSTYLYCTSWFLSLNLTICHDCSFNFSPWQIFCLPVFHHLFSSNFKTCFWVYQIYQNLFGCNAGLGFHWILPFSHKVDHWMLEWALATSGTIWWAKCDAICNGLLGTYKEGDKVAVLGVWRNGYSNCSFP